VGVALGEPVGVEPGGAVGGLMLGADPPQAEAITPMTRTQKVSFARMAGETAAPSNRFQLKAITTVNVESRSDNPLELKLTLPTKTSDTNSRVPDLFIVGAPKSGTTSLYEWLKGHPQVFMTPVKEPCFYARDLARDKSGNFLRYDTDRERFLALFDHAGDAARAGEASTRYLFSRDAAALIAKDQPGARIIAVLRNPVDMIASLHAHKLAGGTEDLADFEDALASEDDREAGRRIPRDSNPLLATYRDRARFGEQIARWFEAFGQDQVFVILFEELVREPSTHFRRLLEFLEVDPTYQPPSFAAHNQAHDSRGGLVRSLARTRPVQFATWRVLPTLIGDGRTRELSRRLGHSKLRRRTAQRADVPEELRRRLEAEFAPDVARLSELLGRDVASVWFGSRPDIGRPSRQEIAIS